jgi:hypothetical protein
MERMYNIIHYKLNQNLMNLFDVQFNTNTKDKIILSLRFIIPINNNIIFSQ